MHVDEFRTGLRAWLDEHDLRPVHDGSLDGHMAQLSRVRRALFDAGWMRWGWPEHAGGLGGPVILRAVLGEEVVARDLAEPGIYTLIEVLAPTLIRYASPELLGFVPKLLAGEETWCQGFSEPGTGSDLASLSTRAVRDGDAWVIDGQKVWTSLAQYARRCVLLTRTGGPGHRGISAFLVDMDSPGITVRPIETMHGRDEFAEVFFDGVRVPAARMLGAEGQGWEIAMSILPDERSSCFWQRIAYLYNRLDRLLAEAPAASPRQLGEAFLDLHAIRCRSRLTQHRRTRGDRLGAETSVDKVLLATAEQRLFDTARDLLPGAVEYGDSPWREEYLYSRAATIYGGTAEIQRNIIAKRLLSLGNE
ncbi:Acyl-CoA dehydrogenase [Thermomonospora echinospora]|uniref:Acyl-CoA dehydrogenase n=1 Tax=Thermomonospora echinospora TaxID=1992 RepID=A0A1H6DKH0_9ACTN|nr:acyl-CoA dehydrogenase family protein [Thermomonospora echinospora]SEG85176.1 Acyl-CoA dehydrogenase [Thermomonospora echinospora]